jgi:hypothetical protein
LEYGSLLPLLNGGARVGADGDASVEQHFEGNAGGHRDKRVGSGAASRVPVFLLALTLFACDLPALKATRMNPASTLKAE